jgi:hypothetical protein
MFGGKRHTLNLAGLNRTALFVIKRKDQSMNSQTKASEAPVRLFLLAGLAGGLAEVAWVGFYGLISSTSAVEVARQITASVIPAAAALPLAPAFGSFIHFLLSALLGVALWTIAGGLIAWRPRADRIMVAAVAFLTAVWAVNFFVVLPVLNPDFVALIPLPIAFLSKALFGVVMGWVLQHASLRATRNTQRAGNQRPFVIDAGSRLG